MPSKIGRQLHIIKPARPGVKPKLLLDLGKGTIGSPSASLDGKFIFTSMAPEGEAFYHIYKIPTDGSKPTRLTKGPFHDLDPAELPDGRIVFSSTRIGTFEEYHSSPSRGLFVMNGDGSDITPITFTSIFDNEPKVMADGSIVFIRSDNFLERAKVETRLHAIRPDGTGGRSIAAADRGAAYGARLRKFGFGCPAPLPDGRLAFISSQGNLLINPGAPRAKAHKLPGNLQDIAPLPDSRLLCTTNNQKNNTIAIINPDKANKLTTLFQSKDGNIHSAVYAGSWPKPKTAIINTLRPKNATTAATGFFLCQNARITRKTAADWPLIRSVRAIGGKVSTLRSSNFQAVHAGLEAIELGTAPLSPDGSFFVEVPADTPIAFQMLDGEGRPQLNEMSWIFVRPGETKSCIGCHEPRGVAPRPADKRIEATKARPMKLVGQGQPIRFRGQNPWVNGLMDMQFERIREIASIGQRGFGKNPNATGAADWKTVESWLASKDAGLRISACQRLGGTHGRRYSGALAGLLKDPDREVRAAAGLALSACGNRASIPHLLGALDDPDPVVAQTASIALENLTAHTAKFNPFVSADQRRQQAGAWRRWFKSLSWDSHEKTLIARLKGTDRVSKHQAVVALGHIGGENAKKALRQFLIQESKTNPYKQRGPGEGITFAANSQLNPRTGQEAARALGYLQDPAGIAVLKNALSVNLSSRKGNLFLAEACLEAMTVIGDERLEEYMIKTFGGLEEFHEYYNWYGGGHPYNEVSMPHFRILDVLDRIGSAKTASLVGIIIRSLPIDVDRQLLFELDDYELMASRVVKRSGCESKVVETCLALLGDTQAVADETLKPSVSKLYRAFAGRPKLENRAAQVLSILCTDRKYEPRIRAVFNRYRQRKREPLFRTSKIRSLVPDRPWVLFYTARLLGKLADPASSPCLISALDKDPTEAAFGRPAPDSIWVGMLQQDNTPCYRAAAAYALGRIGERSARDVLLKTLGNMNNALDVRHASATALKRIADAKTIQAIAKLSINYPEVSVRKVLLAIVQKNK
ncbi:MAG: hypothetical protein HN350_00240 [Phycisphaerales bacterium]|nr:hypothetical protein [Phycisphaerales bacterium]